MIGKTVSHYKILEKLGGGGMGVVYKAEDTRLKRMVALKFLPQDLTRSEEAKKRFMHEAQAASALEHNNICNIHEIDETDDGQLFIVMAYYEGETLKKRIEKGPLKLDEAIDIAAQVAEGLAKAHERELVHRDIKPANIMITSDGVVKIVDFGLAKLAGHTKLTRSGMSLGTLAYMSPEQAQGQEVDHRSDVFSLGTVLYEMLTGQHPFTGDFEAAVVYSLLNEEPEPITSLRTGVPMEYERLVNKALEKNADDRFQHMDEVLVDLRRLQKQSKSGLSGARESISARTPTKRFKFLVVPAALAFVAMLMVAGYFFLSREAVSKERLPIAVVDFVNETEEKELDGLSGMLITSLEQSRRLSVMTRSRMFDILKQLGKKDVERIDETLAREICKHANIPALAIASIRKLDELYIVDLKVIDPHNDVYLVTANEQGQGKSRIPAMLDRLSEKTRDELQEQAADIQANNQKIAEVTTPNPEAYHHYFLGEQLISQREFISAQDEFKKAIALDSTFALAYYKLAYCYKFLEQSKGASEAIQSALRLIHKAPKKERLLIRALQAEIDFDADKAIALSQEFLNRYPTEKAALWQIGEMYGHFKRDTEMARSYFEKVLELDPSYGPAWIHIYTGYDGNEQYDEMLVFAKRHYEVTKDYGLLYRAYIRLGEFDEAREILKQIGQQDPESTWPIWRLTDIYIYEHKYTEAEENQKRMLDAANPLRGTYQLALLNIYLGKYRDALQIYDKRIETYVQRNDSTRIASDYARKAFLLASGWRDFERANLEIEKAMRYPDAVTTAHMLLFNTYLMLGDYDKASSYAQIHPGPAKDGNRQLYVQAQVHFAKDRYDEAIKSFQTSIERGSRWDLFLKRYNLARCYFAAGQYDQAIAEVQKAQMRYYNSYILRAVVYPRGFHLLGKIYEQKGDIHLAMENYEKFLELWKDADEDLPDLIDAKQRLSKLQGVSKK